MSKGAFRVAYDGEALAGHTMDVRDLAPALLALGEVFVESNKILNGDRAAVEIHVTPKIEDKCFDIGLEVLRNWGAVKEFLGLSDVVAAKGLVDWIALGTGATLSTVGGGYGLLRLFRHVRGKKPQNVIRFKDENGNPLVRLQFDGEMDHIIDERMYKLYKNDKIRLNVGRIFNPLLLRRGIDVFVAYREGERSEGFQVSEAEVREIDFTPSGPEAIEDTYAPGVPFEAMLKVYSPVYDSKAPRWRFWYGKQRFYMDVSESNIRDVVFENGGALVDDWFRVMLQVVEEEASDGKKSITYKVLEVLEFLPAYRQADMFSRKQETKDPEGGDENGHA